jgi:glutamate-1-semialdehyde aminotransferase
VSEYESIWDRACRVLAAGRWNPSGGVTHARGAPLPLMIASSEGCRSTDTNGRPYIDYMMGWGTAILGFCHPAVDAAIRSQLERGITPTLTSPLEVEVAERLRAMVPAAEMVAFGKNGSDVLALAVRVSRAYTGRERVLFHGYHGIQDWYLASVPRCPGIPHATRALIAPLPYNDLEATRELFAREGRSIAAVVMEAANDVLPAAGYLEAVRELCESHGAILVFDEVITGLRLARGGAQEYYGVRPHLACFAKTLGNGMPLAALVGARGLDEAVGTCVYGLTFRGETLSLAAARATLDVVRTEPVIEHLWRVGTELRTRVDESARRLGVAVTLRGPAPRMTFRFEPQPRASSRALLTLFVQECLVRGVLHNSHLLPSYAHSDEVVSETARVFHEALEVVGRAIARRDVDAAIEIPPLALWFGEDGDASNALEDREEACSRKS